MKNFRLSRNSKNNLKGVREEIKTLVDRVLVKSPHDFGIPRDGGLRTAERQNELFNQIPKVTSCDGYHKLSYHQSGNAFDIFIYDEHGACWECTWKYDDVSEIVKAEFKIMQDEGLFSKDEIIRWGGDWRNPDRPHFEIKQRRLYGK